MMEGEKNISYFKGQNETKGSWLNFYNWII